MSAAATNPCLIRIETPSFRQSRGSGCWTWFDFVRLWNEDSGENGKAFRREWRGKRRAPSRLEALASAYSPRRFSDASKISLERMFLVKSTIMDGCHSRYRRIRRFG